MEGNKVQHVTVLPNAIQEKAIQRNTIIQQQATLEWPEEDTEADDTADQPVYKAAETAPNILSDKLNTKDEYAGDRVSEMADNVFAFGVIISVVLGFIVWIMAGNVIGLVLDALVIVAGIFLSRGLSVFLKGYAQLIQNSAEQMKILKHMEHERATELIRQAQAAAAEATAAAEVAVAAAQEIMQDQSSEKDLEPDEDISDEVRFEYDDIDEEANRRAVIAAAEEVLSDEVKAKIFNAHNPGAKKLNPFVPTQEAVETDQFNRIAVFSSALRQRGEMSNLQKASEF